MDYLDGKHTVFGEVSKGFDVLEKLNECICDKEGRPYQDIRIFHTVILDDPFEDFPMLKVENERASPEPTEQVLAVIFVFKFLSLKKLILNLKS